MGLESLIGLGISLAVSAVSTLFQTPQKIKKPETSLRVPRSEYDSPLPKIYGKGRVEGNKFWPAYVEQMYRIETETTSQGGKGGGGGGKGGQQTETDKVFGTWAVVFCAGEAVLHKIIINGQEFETSHPFFQQYCTFFDGRQTTPWSAMELLETAGEAEIAYKGVVYIGFRDVPLEIYGNQIPTQIGAILSDRELGLYPDVSVVVKDICQKAGLPLDKIDVSDIVAKFNLHEGLLVTQNGESSRKTLEELMQFYLFTAVEKANGVIAFKSYDRGLFTPETFPPEHYLPISENTIFEVVRTSKTQLPNKISVRFYNYNQKYDADTIIEYFEDFSQENDFRVETNIFTDAYQARQQARKILKFVTARQRYTYKFKLPAIYYSYIELLDCYQLPNGEIVQLDKITLNPDYTIEVSARRYTGVNDFIYDPPNPPAQNSIPSLIDPLQNGIPDVYFLDIPVINPNNPPNTLYIIASAPNTVNISFDGGNSYVASVNHTATSTIGECETALPSANGLDIINTLNVQLFTGSLSSISQTQFDTGSNLALIARQNNGIWEGELIRFKTVLPLGSDRYTISYLQRGDFNTNNFSNNNNIGDKFFLLKGDSAYYSFYANTTNVGQPITYQPIIAPWQDLNTTPAITVTTVGNSYSPPTVSNIQSFIDEQGNIKITWDYNSSTSVFNNTQENITFEIDIEPSVRTIASINKQIIYLGSLRNTDGITLPFNINIYGVSSLVGRGSASFYTVANPILSTSTTFFDNANSAFSQIVSVNSNLFQLNSNVIYEVSTFSGPLTLLMPTNPELGDRVYVLDGPGFFSTNPCTLDGGIFDLEGSGVFILSQFDEHIEFVFDGNQWIYLNRFFLPKAIETVTDGITTVQKATQLTFVGATITDSGGGIVTATIDLEWGLITGTLSDQLDLQTALDALQPLLISQTNIKSINNVSLLGSGNMIIDASTIPNFNESVDDRVGSLLVAGTRITLNYNDTASTLTINADNTSWGSIIGTLSNQIDLQNALNAKQATLVNQSNIKSINGNSLLGSGDLVINSAISIRVISSNTTLAETDYNKFIRASGTITITLPNGLSTGFTCTIQNAGTNTITFIASGTLDSGGSTLVAKYDTAQVIHLGSNLWTIVGALT